MTLADILKPSVTVIAHAEVKGATLGAGLATLAAIPALLIRPNLINPKDEPPLVAIANIAGLGGFTGATCVSLVCAYKMSKLTKDEIIERADKILNNEEQRKADVAAVSGAALGIGLVAARVGGIAKMEGVQVSSVLCRKQTLWEVCAFCMMGSAVSVGAFIAAKKVAQLVKSRCNDSPLSEIDEGSAEQAVKDIKDVKDDVVKDAEQAVKDAVDSTKDKM